MLSKEQNKKFALERQEAASKRSPIEQLARLDNMLGVGKGAKKERAKLAKKMEHKVEVVEEVKAEKPKAE